MTPLAKALLLVAFSASVQPSARADETTLRQRLSLDADWRFQKADPAGAGDALAYGNLKAALLASTAGFLAPLGSAPVPAPAVPADLGAAVAYTQPGFDDTGWRHLDLPHDWGIEGPFQQELPGESGKLPWSGVAWYRKHFDVPAADSGCRTFLDIDGAMSYAAVWCNGRFVGGWPYGYASWQVELTPFLKPGESNVLAIRLDNPPNSSRWYPGSGIYRHVWLEKTAPVHVAHWGSYVTTPQISDDAATVTIATTLDNQTGADADPVVHTELFECGPDGRPAGDRVASAGDDRPPAANGTATQVRYPHPTVKAGGSQVAYEQATIPHPKRWDLEHPDLYVAVTTIEQNQHPVDRVETIFGVRTILFTSDNGFLLNGKRVQLQGVCDHHDLGALGNALNDRALQRQLEILQGMGCNAIRTSHNPPAPELLALADRLGMLVMDESFDMWEISKRPNGYGLLFDDWHDRDQRALVRRDRNHPSVILWSLGNEIPEQGRPQGPLMAAELAGDVRMEDYSRPTTYACSDTKGGYNGYQKAVDVFGYNYRPDQYGNFRAANPTIPIFGSETASTVSSRGEYFFPPTGPGSSTTCDFQVTSYDLRGTRLPDAEFKGLDQYPFAAGEFVWTGFDYLGEPSPFGKAATTRVCMSDPARQARVDEELKATGKVEAPSRSSYFGIIDLAGFPKDRYYLYQSRWRPALPMAHLLPHWTWPERAGQVTPVYVYTTGDEAELFLNGRSLGRKKKEPLEYRLKWEDVTYAPGELKAVAYKDGQPWATDVERTAGPAARLALRADRAQLAADGRDLAFVSATITDAGDVPAPRAADEVRFEVTGPADVLATDNGDATSFEPFQAPEHRAFNGKCLAIVRTRRGVPGTIIVRATAGGLSAGSVELQSR